MKTNKRKVAIVGLNVVGIILSSIALGKSILSKRKAKKEDAKEEPSHPLAPPFTFHADGSFELTDSFEDTLEANEAKEEFEFHMEGNKEIDTFLKDLSIDIKASTNTGFDLKYLDVLERYLIDIKQQEPTRCVLAVRHITGNNYEMTTLFSLSAYKVYTLLALLAMGMKPIVEFNMGHKHISKTKINGIERKEMGWGTCYIFSLDAALLEKDYSNLSFITISSNIDEFRLDKANIIKTNIIE